MSSTFSVITNLPSLVAQHNSTQNQQSLQRTLFRLSTGQRLFRGGEDPTGMALADGLHAQIRTLEQSIRNANDGVGFAQVADSALGQIQNLLGRAASLLSEAESDTNSSGEVAIETELAQIYQEIDRIGSATSFNGTTVFSATTINIFVGDTQNLAASNAQIGVTTSVLSLADLSITSGISGTGSGITVAIDGTNTVTDMLGEVEAAIDTVASRRGRLGASMNRLENAVSVMQSQVQNLTAAESQIRDADFAAEIANLTKFQILSQVGVAAMAQANAVPQSVLSLFQ